MKEINRRKLFYTKWDSHLTIFDKFWMKVDKRGIDDCWNYCGVISRSGYGFFYYNHKTLLAHRLAYSLTFGEIDKGLQVCHKCDNKKCCNPAHLFLGTQQDNMTDKTNKGRCNPARGERSGSAKLTEGDVEEIRRMGDSGIIHKLIAEKFGVSRSHITRLIGRGEWKHVN